MSIEHLRVGIISGFNKDKNFGFIRSDGQSFFFHINGYVSPIPSDTAGYAEPELDESEPPIPPSQGTAVVFWAEDASTVQPGKKPVAYEWTYVSLWNQAMVESIENKKRRMAEFENSQPMTRTAHSFEGQLKTEG